MSRVLKDDGELQRAIEAMQRFCDIIDDPLSDSEEVKETTWRLNATAELVQVYSRGRVAERHPDRIPHYNDMGLEYQVFA